jgi:hypothetical protein
VNFAREPEGRIGCYPARNLGIHRINRTRFRGTELSAAVKSSEIYMVCVGENTMVY